MEIELTQFKGPLDLLLNLIQKQELDISNISLAKVTDQYLQFIKETKLMNPDELIYFIDIASQLIILKTKILTPYLTSIEEEEEDETDLIAKLQIYTEYLEAAKRLESLWNDQSEICLSSNRRKLSSVDKSISILELQKITTAQLKNRMNFIIRKLAPPTLSTKLKRQLNIKAKIELITNYLENKKDCFFKDFLPNNPAKLDIIVSFIALLELNKKQILCVSQNQCFHNISVKKIIYE